MDCLYIVMPAYNEEKNIEKTVTDWYPLVNSLNERKEAIATLLIINDGSKDQTGQVLERIASSKPYMEIFSKPNSGHGPTLICGYQYALEHGADYIFQTDSDGQTEPLEFQSFWEERKQYDAIFGNRTERGDGKQRAFVEHTLCRILKHYFKVTIPDANAPFRLMRADYVKEYLNKLPRDYNLPNVMLTTYGVYYKRKIKFVPISFKPRVAGKNSINVKRIVGIGMHAMNDFKALQKKL